VKRGMRLASCPNRPRLIFGVVGAKLSSVGFSIRPSPILANRLDPQSRTTTRTIGALNTYQTGEYAD
jgi:hypothetical protein